MRSLLPVLMLFLATYGEAGVRAASRSNGLCEAETGAENYLKRWLSWETAHGGTGCVRHKECNNCCGSGTRYDKFYVKCAKGASSPNETPGPAVPQAEQMMRRCFCLKWINAGGFQQYRVQSYPTSPQCSQAVYRPPVGRPNYEVIHPCDALSECAKNAAQCKAKLDAITKKLAETTDVDEIMRLTKERQPVAQKCAAVDAFCYVERLNR